MAQEQAPSLPAAGGIAVVASGSPPLEGKHLAHMVSQVRDMIDYVDNAGDATLLVRRANATGDLIDEALKTCHLMADEQFELRQLAAEAHLRTQRRAGELLSELRKHGGGRPRKTHDHSQAVSGHPRTLRELGIATHESHRWQRIASIPADTFERYIAECRNRKREITTTRVVALAGRMVTATRSNQGSGASATSGSLSPAEYSRMTRAIGDLLRLDPICLAADLTCIERVSAIPLVLELGGWFQRFEQALQSHDGLDVRQSALSPSLESN